MGVHPNLPNVAQAYKDGEASFFANIGSLVEPITKAEYKAKTKKTPPALFSHNIMQRSLHNQHPQDSSSAGVIGRMFKALTEQSSPYKSQVYSLMGNVKALEGSLQPNIVSPWSGIEQYGGAVETASDFEKINGNVSTCPLSETFSAILQQTLKQTEFLGPKLKSVSLTHPFNVDHHPGRNLDKVAKLIKLRSELKYEREAYYVQLHGYDTHFYVDYTSLWGNLDEALGNFKKEMVAQGIWDGVTVVVVSEFGRQLKTNGQGTDHAWGSNQWIMGGSVKGGQIHDIRTACKKVETTTLEVTGLSSLLLPGRRSTSHWLSGWALKPQKLLKSSRISTISHRVPW
eukprot:CAMPEP_0175118958 /NCGR_PEP_ID=MMETSP0086_2-20121207/19891_1 /TAXON_ID=136419 /ORGANISM="Unknown Unknown, Strain D1" /LENGTH=342 /DNA_ID=CAMNT_0016400157 /DNA_START=16 /DNA_END=1044 /DNA_ORIENTATION=+